MILNRSYINFREDVEGGLWLYAADPRDIDEGFVNKFPLFVDPSAGNDIVFHALMAAQGCLDDGLGGHIGAQTHIGEHFQPFDIIRCDPLISAEDHPADPETGDHMGFGQTAEGDAEQVGCQGSDGYMFFPVHDQTVVNLIGENDQLMFSGNIHDLLQNLSGIEGSGGIVGIDDDNGLCPVCDLLFDIFHVRIPVGLLVTDIVDGFSSGQSWRRRSTEDSPEKGSGSRRRCPAVRTYTD